MSKSSPICVHLHGRSSAAGHMSLVHRCPRRPPRSQNARFLLVDALRRGYPVAHNGCANYSSSQLCSGRRSVFTRNRSGVHPIGLVYLIATACSINKHTRNVVCDFCRTMIKSLYGQKFSSLRTALFSFHILPSSTFLSSGNEQSAHDRQLEVQKLFMKEQNVSQEYNTKEISKEESTQLLGCLKLHTQTWKRSSFHKRKCILSTVKRTQELF